MMKTNTHTCQAAESSTPSSGFIARVKGVLLILREVLRGFTAGHPPDDARPRKGCC